MFGRPSREVREIVETVTRNNLKWKFDKTVSYGSCILGISENLTVSFHYHDDMHITLSVKNTRTLDTVFFEKFYSVKGPNGGKEPNFFYVKDFFLPFIENAKITEKEELALATEEEKVELNKLLKKIHDLRCSWQIKSWNICDGTIFCLTNEGVYIELEGSWGATMSADRNVIISVSNVKTKALIEQRFQNRPSVTIYQKEFKTVPNNNALQKFMANIAEPVVRAKKESQENFQQSVKDKFWNS